MVTERGTSSSGRSYAERMVAMSLPLPVGADMIALATLVVAVSGSIVDDEVGSGAMVYVVCRRLKATDNEKRCDEVSCVAKRRCGTHGIVFWLGNNFLCFVF